jgi:hypothetical protein
MQLFKGYWHARSFLAHLLSPLSIQTLYKPSIADSKRIGTASFLSKTSI